MKFLPLKSHFCPIFPRWNNGTYQICFHVSNQQVSLIPPPHLCPICHKILWIPLCISNVSMFSNPTLLLRQNILLLLGQFLQDYITYILLSLPVQIPEQQENKNTNRRLGGYVCNHVSSNRCLLRILAMYGLKIREPDFKVAEIFR